MRGHPRLLVPSPPRLGVVRPHGLHRKPPQRCYEAYVFTDRHVFLPKRFRAISWPSETIPVPKPIAKSARQCSKMDVRTALLLPTKSSRAEVFLLFGHPPSEQHHDR